MGKARCSKCGLVKDCLFWKQKNRDTLMICHECLKKEQEKSK